MLIFREIDTFLTVIECYLQFVWVWVDSIPFHMSLHNREVCSFTFFCVTAAVKFTPAFGATVKNQWHM